MSRKPRKHACPTCGRVQPLWTPTAIIDALRAWAYTHGRSPTSRDWKKSGLAHPSSVRVYSVFGSWPTALEAAGLTPRGNEWNRSNVKDAIFRFRFEHGRLPKTRDWRNASDQYPCETTVRKLFGTWNAAIAAAGYEPHHRRRNTTAAAGTRFDGATPAAAEGTV